MTQEELNTWVAYVEENGPLNPTLRFDAAVARVASRFLRGVKPRDLMPWPREPEVAASIEEVFGVLTAAAKSNKKPAPPKRALKKRR